MPDELDAIFAAAPVDPAAAQAPDAVRGHAALSPYQHHVSIPHCSHTSILSCGCLWPGVAQKANHPGLVMHAALMKPKVRKAYAKLSGDAAPEPAAAEDLDSRRKPFEGCDCP